MTPATMPQPRPTASGTITGRSIAQSPKIALGLGLPLTIAVCAKLIVIIAVAPTTEPDERSMPPLMMTWVTPMAMMPTIDTWRMMMLSRAQLKIASILSRVLNRKLSWRNRRPRISKAATITTSAMKTLSSCGLSRRAGSYFRPPRPCVACATSFPSP